jgi:6-phosphogluconate dehydrogenase
MADTKREYGVVGLGRMGGNLARQALEKGIRVVGLLHRDPHEDIVGLGMEPVRTGAELKAALAPPRVVFLYVPAGTAVDSWLDELAGVLEAGDVLVDGGNSYWGDSIRRHARLKSKGIRFVDLGTSGGSDGARRGACFMAGGDHDAVAVIEPIITALAVEGGYVHAGPPGAGHFTKLVHNGIEFGMLQAIGEGVDLLEHYHDKLDTAAVLRCWRNGSVIRSWLIDLMEEAYRKGSGMSGTPSYVEDTGEVNWLVGDALQMEVPVPVIAQAVMQLLTSRDGDKHWARAIAMMRHGFGGHPFGPDESVAKERREGRVGDFFRPDKPGEKALQKEGN